MTASQAEPLDFFSLQPLRLLIAQVGLSLTPVPSCRTLTSTVIDTFIVN
jgi:hypothetical protein